MENVNFDAQNEHSVVNKTKNLVKDFFLNLATFFSLYWLTISFIILIFQIINTIYPDSIFKDTNTISTFSLSSVIVLAPVFLYLAYKTNSEIIKDNSKKDLWIRRWLIYITLFVSGATIIGDIIAFINFFLNGDLTSRFILKILVVILVPGFIFWYLRYLIKRDYSKNTYNKPLVAFVSIVLITVIVYTFTVVGSPSQKRKERVDQERVSDLVQIQSEIISYWQIKKTLPENLNVLNDPLRNFLIPNDPSTNEPYGYEIIDNLSFKICANFESTQLDYVDKTYATEFSNDVWNHQLGNVCFERSIDPERYAIPKVVY